MRWILDLDTSVHVCPCGATSEYRAGTFREWECEHYDHTDGTVLEIVTDDGARCLDGKPKPRLTAWKRPTPEPPK